MTYDVAIIGAGISGLTAAYDLQRNGRRIIVLERQQMVGGNAISERINGFLMEHGPTTLNNMVPEALELTKELGLVNQRQYLGEGVAKRYLRHGRVLHGISIHRAGFLLSPYISLRGRLSVMAELLRSRQKNDEDETIHEFASRRFGVEFADKVMAPLVAGMFAGNAHILSVKAAFPRLKKMEQEYGSISRAILQAKHGHEPGKRLFSYQNGIASLPQTLARGLDGCIKTGAAVKSISQTPGGYKVETQGLGALSAKSVIFAAQPHVAASLLEPLDTQTTTAVADIDAPPLAVVFLAYARSQVEHPLDSLGFLSVPGTGGIINGAQFSSTMFANRAPDGFVTISAYVGGSINRDAAGMSSHDLCNQVHSELSGLLGIKGAPVLSRTRQWARSLPQYELGHCDKVMTMKTLSQRQPGLYLTGNYLEGVSVASCIKQARTTAALTNQYLAGVEQGAIEKFNVG